jgi:hypothetical protein
MIYTKLQASYTHDHGQSDEQCSKCRHYFNQPQGLCELVKGDIAYAGWCRLFDWFTNKSER